MHELEELDLIDEDIFARCFATIGNKKRINNMAFFSYFNETMIKYNNDPNSPFFKKLDANIAQLKEKHYNTNREWRYNFDKGEMRPL